MADERRGTRAFFTGIAAFAFFACAGPGNYMGPAHSVRPGTSETDITVTDLASGKLLASGKAPLRLRLESALGGTAGIYKGGNFRITVSKANERVADFAMKFGNVNFGGVVRWIIVDPDSGAAWQLE